jgi:hypothetical protein
MSGKFLKASDPVIRPPRAPVVPHKVNLATVYMYRRLRKNSADFLALNAKSRTPEFARHLKDYCHSKAVNFRPYGETKYKGMPWPFSDMESVNFAWIAKHWSAGFDFNNRAVLEEWCKEPQKYGVKHD